MIETAIINEGWDEVVDWQTLASHAVSSAIEHTPHAAIASLDIAVEIAVRLTSDDEVRKLNAAYRHKDRSTNVLSFPLVSPDLLQGLANTDDGEVLLGDIVMARDICNQEAEQKDIAMMDHASHLLVHGTLHLLGYDHETETDAIVMETLETKALAKLGIANPYADQHSE